MPKVRPIAITAQIWFVSHDLALIGQSYCLFLTSIKRICWCNAQVEDSLGKHQKNTSHHQPWLSVGLLHLPPAKRSTKVNHPHVCLAFLKRNVYLLTLFGCHLVLTNRMFYVCACVFETPSERVLCTDTRFYGLPNTWSGFKMSLCSVFHKCKQRWRLLMVIGIGTVSRTVQ